MSHPTLTLLCTDCQSLFRTHRALKIHQQRHQTTLDISQPNYNYISSYLVVAFSSPKFPLMCERACLQGHLPLGEFSSKFYRCSTCQISFPCSRSLNYHLLNHHDDDHREISKKILDEILNEIERFSPLIDDESQMNLIAHASQFGLKRKTCHNELRRLKSDDDQRIYPKCFHSGRTCANLCLNYLVSHDDFIRNHSFQIVQQAKGNPFSQGSIVAKHPVRSIPSTPVVQETNVTTTTTDSFNTENSKRRVIKRTQSSLTDISQPKRSLSRSASSVVLQSKRQRSPTIPYLSPKRRRQRKKLDDDVEQENDDEDNSTTKFSKPKQRQASTGSIEYVQVLNHDGQTISSLNNIENVKSKSTDDDEEIILCRSTSTTSNFHNKTSKSSVQTLDPNEHIRVRCKVCGDIIEGRSRFSKHVLTMHSHLLGKTIPEATQQTTTVR